MASGSRISGNDRNWLSKELAGCEFEDERLGKRFRTLTEQLWDGRGKYKDARTAPKAAARPRSQ
jgi:hypothetical protein